MRKQSLRMSMLLAVLLVTAVGAQAPQPPTGDARFTGRWELRMIPPTGQSSQFDGGIPVAIVEIASNDGVLAGKVVHSLVGTGKVSEIAVKNDELVFVLQVEVSSQTQTLTCKAKRVGDHLEGSGLPSGTTTEVTLVAQLTTKDTLAMPTPKPPSADQKAYSAALRMPRAKRVEALRQFLKDYPTSAMKNQAEFQIAQSLEKPEEKIAALKKYIEDYPKSAEQGYLQIALTPTDKAEKAAGLKKFIADYPKSRLKDRAEYELTLTVPAGKERDAAQVAFIKAYPKSMYTSAVIRPLLDRAATAKPVDETALGALIDAYVKVEPDPGTPGTAGLAPTELADRCNTVADRLMDHDVMLGRALELIKEALAAAGEKSAAPLRAMYTTTYGQVLYKMKDLDAAERELKRALEIGASDIEGDIQLYLGKIYEARGNDDAALNAYLTADQLSSSKDSRTSLERAWTKKHGSVAGLDDKLDALYNARKKPFEAGTFTRPTAPGPARVVLAELFTGAECGPCVAADMAFDGVAERYDRKTVAILQYHLHIPGPDPMTNADTDARSKIYDVGGTPTMSIDGLEPQVGGGSETAAGRVFGTLKEKIEARLKEMPQATLSGFSAKVSGQRIAVSGQAALAAAGAEKIKKATLHVALVQDVVRYVGANGVRFHHFVVRKMLGPEAGLPLSTGGAAVTFAETVDLAAVTAALDSYLTEFEKERSESRGSAFTFTSKVTALKAADMRVVVFVQDDETKEVLQAVVIDPS